MASSSAGSVVNGGEHETQEHQGEPDGEPVMQGELSFSTDREAQQSGPKTLAARPEIALADEDIVTIG
jgi:hypothetical protein